MPFAAPCLAWYNVGSAVTERYIRAGASLIAQVVGSNVYFYLHNAHGDVVQRTDANGNALHGYEYDAYGVAKMDYDFTVSPFGYCGEYTDKETGLIYLRNRYYEPRTGAFTQEDPAKDGANWYGYCGGNPVALVDPMGLESWSELWEENSQRISDSWSKLKNSVNNELSSFKSTVNKSWTASKDRINNTLSEIEVMANDIKDSVTEVVNDNKAVLDELKGNYNTLTSNAIDFVQNVVSSVDATYSTGYSIAGVISHFSGNLQAGLSIDTDGNVRLQGTAMVGASTGTPVASITRYEMITNAPSVDHLNGPSTQVGGSIATPVYGVPLAAGGEVNLIPDFEKDTTYYGVTRAVGLGTPGGEVHWESGTTASVPYIEFNIFDVLRDIQKAIFA